jgi:hypothetical protein
MKNSFVRNIILVAALFLLLFGLQFVRTPQEVDQSMHKTAITVSPVPAKKADVLSYSGKEGIDALTLLENKVPVGKETSGLVSSINGRMADAAKHEYWAFYVNGKLAEVGPHEYVTKDTDTIEWKIEKY